MAWDLGGLSKWCASKWKITIEKFPHIPLIGHLVRCRLVDYWGAAVEYSHSLLWSTMPFWLGAFLIYIQYSSGDKSLIEIFTDTFRNGELLVYTISTLTPITYLTLYDYREKRFPHRLGVGTIAITMIISSASLFALQKGQVQLKTSDLFSFSVSLAVCAILLRYIAILYNRTPLPTLQEKDLTSDKVSFLNDFHTALDKQESEGNEQQLIERSQNDFLAKFNDIVDTPGVSDDRNQKEQGNA